MKTVTGRLVLDEHVASVVEFMERNIPADRLEYVAVRLPALAKVIWSAERSARVESRPLSMLDERPLNATESAPDRGCAGGDFGAANCAPER